MNDITLRSASLGLVLAPTVGGAITRFWCEVRGPAFELLRRTPPEAVARGDPLAMGSFPLVPWSNRIRDGRFTFRASPVCLPANHAPERHAIHGHGWQAPWTLVDAGPAAARLEYRHVPDAWPWAYRAVQHLTLTSVALTLELGLTNESETPMPAGIGWHPYFPRTAATTLTARVAGMWLTDAEVLPVAHVTPPPDRDPGRGLPVDRVVLDNVFTGWDGQAVIAWPERTVRLHMAASPPVQSLVVYTPPGRPFFCAEPVSHATDAFNLAASGRTDTGMLTVPPGETVRASLTLTPEVA